MGVPADSGTDNGGAVDAHVPMDGMVLPSLSITSFPKRFAESSQPWRYRLTVNRVGDVTYDIMSGP